MSAVAEQLRKAREAQNLTVQHVVDITKIRTDHLLALEEGNFDVFSAPVYIKGFVRTYSTILKLDVAKVMGELEEELGQTKKFAEPPPLSDEPRGALDFVTLQLSKLDPKKTVIVLVVIAVVGAIAVGLVAMRHKQKTDPLSGLKPGVYHSTQHVSGETLPLPGHR